MAMGQKFGGQGLYRLSQDDLEDSDGGKEQRGYFNTTAH